MSNPFKRKPKRCQKCSCEQPKLHTVYSAYYKEESDEIPIEVCTPCLSRMFLESLQNFSARAVFIEPISEDGYVFVRFTDEPDQVNMALSLKSFLATEETKCTVCARTTTYCWLPLEVTMETARAKTLQYHDKSTLTDYQYLCAEHLCAQFMECVEKNQFYFPTLRLPVGDCDAFCY